MLSYALLVTAHPNICLFITHAGMLSTQEAIYHGVPVVGIPFMGDQFSNIIKLSTRGVGVELVYHTLSKQSILNAVQTVLGNHR
jgi:UDP:flavonoid glycosyltransferase YjiC (YdhE family)